MRRFALIASLMLTIGSLAWGANLLGSTVSSGAVITPPSGASAGFAVVSPNSVQSFTVTVSDVRDGSVGDTLDSVLNADAFAWCYPSNNPFVAPDGGGGWSRLQALDVRMRTSDAGTGAEGTGAHAAQSGTAFVTTTGNVGVDCARIAYTVGNTNIAWDSGVLVYRVSVSETD